MTEKREMILNFGPQHPSTHGVLRLLLELDGEVIKDCDIQIGYLHRGIEKLAEHRRYNQIIPLTDRLDYISAGSNNLAYCLAVEKLLGIEVPRRANFIRVIIAELTRMSSHLLGVGTHVLDMGAFTPMLYAFREREMIMDLFDAYCGARLTLNCFRIGGVMADLPEGFIEKAKKFTDIFPAKVDEYETLLTKNRIWMERTQGVGVIPANEAINWGLSGPVLRGSGVKWDIRKAEPYCVYDEMDFDIVTQEAGDVYARYLVRLGEMRQSCRIVRQAIEQIPQGRIMVDDPRYVLPPRERLDTSIESLIHQFHLVIDGFAPPPGDVYASIEAPKGELGLYIISDGSGQPYRLRIRPPSFLNLQFLKEMIKGQMVADIVAAIGSLDIVLGEVDK
ncbi:MAG: NADH dehydrogenase (quinone) subunit D [bacterium]